MHPTMAILKLRRPSNTKPGSTSATPQASAFDSGRLDGSSNNDGRPLMLSPTVRSPQVPTYRSRSGTPSSAGGKKKSYLEKPRKDLPETKQRRECVNKSLQSALEAPLPDVRQRGILHGWGFRNIRFAPATHQDDLDTDSLHHHVGWKSLDDSDDNLDDLLFKYGGSCDSQTAEISQGSSIKSSQSTLATHCTSASNNHDNRSTIHVFRKSQCKTSLTASTDISAPLKPPSRRNTGKADHQSVQSPLKRPQCWKPDDPSLNVNQSLAKSPGRIVRSKSAEWTKFKAPDNGQSIHSKQCLESTRKLPQRSKSSGTTTRVNYHTPSPSTSRSKSVEACQLKDFHEPTSKQKNQRYNGMENRDILRPMPSPNNRSKSQSATKRHSSLVPYDGCVHSSCLLPQVAPSTPQTRSKPSLLASPALMEVSPWLKTESDRSNSSRSSIAAATRLSVMGEPTQYGSTSNNGNHQRGLSSASVSSGTPHRTELTPKSHKAPHEYISSTLEEQRALAKELAEALSALPVTPMSESQRRRSSWVAAERSKISSSPSPSLHRRPSLEPYHVSGPPSVQATLTAAGKVASSSESVHSSCHNRPGSTGSVHSSCHNRPSSTESVHSSCNNRRSPSKHGGETPFMTRRQRSHGPAPRARPSIQRTPSQSSLKSHRHQDPPPQPSAAPSPRSRPTMRRSLSQSSLKSSRSHTRGAASRAGRPDLRATYSHRSLLSRRRSQEASRLQRSVDRSCGAPRDAPSVSSVPTEAAQQDEMVRNVPALESRGDKAGQFDYSNPNLEEWDSSSSMHSSASSSSSSGTLVSASDLLDEDYDGDHLTSEHPPGCGDEPKDPPENDSNSPEVGLIGNMQEIAFRTADENDNDDEDNEPSQSTKSISLDGIAAQQLHLQQSASKTPIGKASMHESSIDLSLMLSHMSALHRLEQLSHERAEAACSAAAGRGGLWALRQRQFQDRRVQARLHLLAVTERAISPEEFQDLYRLTATDAESVTSHFQLCLEMDEEIRWDLIFQVLFPEPAFEVMPAAGAGTEGTNEEADPDEAEDDDIRTLDSKVLYGK
jgi:hypothetical protein